MIPSHDWSMRARILAPLGVTVGLVALVVLIGLPLQLQATTETWSEKRVASLAIITAEAAKSGLDFADADFARARLALLATSEDARYAVLVQADGAPLAAWGVVPDALPKLDAVDGPIISRVGDDLVVDVPVVARGGAKGHLISAFSTDHLQATLARDRQIGASVALGILALGATLGWFYASALVRPLRRLTEVARLTAVGEIVQRAAELAPVERYRRDERVVLAQTILDLAARLQAQLTSLDEQRRRAERAEDEARRASIAKSRFLANMSHELRTPLNAIIGYAELMIEEIGAPGAARADLERVAGAGRHLLAIINDILDLSKVEAERMAVNFRSFAVRPLVDELVASLRPLVEQKGNVLRVTVAADAEQLESDALRVRQCLYNLLSNATKFTDGGEVSLAVELRDGQIVFTVSDTGIGIAEEHLPQLFQPFSQVDGSSTRRYMGTGLGLALTRRIAQLLGGDVTVRSTLGVGSAFCLSLPRGILRRSPPPLPPVEPDLLLG